MKKYTILDIAELSGVGKSTVSRVINGEDGVKEATRKKVLEIINEVGFTPSKSARSMRSSKSGTIGIISTRLDSQAENRAIRGMLDEIYKRGYDAVLLESNFSIQTTKKHINTLLNKEVEGIIIFAIGGEKYEFLKAISIPTIMIAQDVQGFPSIHYNDYKAISDLMNYIYFKKNVKKIGFIGVDRVDPTTGKNRYEAYKDFCTQQNLPLNAKFGDFSYESAFDNCKNLLADFPECEGIVCATDNIVLGVRKYLEMIGKSNLCVAGVGDVSLVSFLFPKHITIKFEYKNSGKIAIDRIFKMIDGDILTKNIKLDGKLIEYK